MKKSIVLKESQLITLIENIVKQTQLAEAKQTKLKTIKEGQQKENNTSVKKSPKIIKKTK